MFNRTTGFLVATGLAALLAFSSAFRTADAQQTANPPEPKRPPGVPAPNPEYPPALGKGAFDPIVTWSGPNSEIAVTEFVRITSEAEWRALWERHTGSAVKKSHVDEPFMPRVNFEKAMVVGVFKGATWNSDGAFCWEVKEDGDTLRFRFDERTYQTLGPDGGGVKVKPFGLFVIPRTDKALSIEENVQGLKDQPTKWKERARFDAIRS